jgi:two-component system, NtrC family, nitrogen regulation sensor histidine kinase GlnL
MNAKAKKPVPMTGIIWASLPIPAVLIDERDIIIDLNPEAELFLNISARAVRNTALSGRVMIDAPLEEIFPRVRRNQSVVTMNNVDVGTGEKAPVSCTLHVAPLADDSPRLMILMSPRDIAARMGRSHSVKTSAKSAIGMAEMLAHEIKNPLAGITGAAQLLSMNLTPEDQELTDLIVAESRRIVKLLEQVEQFGNLRPPERRAVNIHDLLDRARKSAIVGFATHMRVEEDYDPSLPSTWADGDQLVQVFLNLLKNAAEAADKQGGKIRIRTFYEPSLRVRTADGANALPLQVEIIDNGPGLPPAIANDVFEPFVSGRENGTGLGLALVSKIITDHGGWVTVDSVPGRTTFRISLPIAPKQAEEDH